MLSRRLPFDLQSYDILHPSLNLAQNSVAIVPTTMTLLPFKSQLNVFVAERREERVGDCSGERVR